jgi:hypothetical protein
MYAWLGALTGERGAATDRKDFSMVKLLTPAAPMFDRLIHFSIHHKLVVGLLTLALVAWGSYSLRRLPIDAVPDITTNQIVIYTVAPSLAASDIERLVSFPVEQSLATIPGREEVRSFSRFGLSVVTIVFEDQIDIYWARQQVAERLREAESQIPASIGRPGNGARQHRPGRDLPVRAARRAGATKSSTTPASCARCRTG